MNKHIKNLIEKYHEYYTNINPFIRTIITPSILAALIVIIKMIDSTFGVIITFCLIITVTFLQQSNIYIETKEREKWKLFSSRHFKVLNWINELANRKSKWISESISSGMKAKLKDENRRALLITKIAMRNSKFHRCLDEIITIIHDVIREIAIMKFPEHECNLNVRVNLMGRNPNNAQLFRVLSYKETSGSTLSASDIENLKVEDKKTIISKLWNSGSEKFISINDTSSCDFYFFNDEQKDQLKSVMFYRIDEIDDDDEINGGKSTPFCVICVDANIKNLFPKKEKDIEEFNFYKVMLRSFEIRVVYEARFAKISNHVENIINKELEHEPRTI